MPNRRAGPALRIAATPSIHQEFTDIKTLLAVLVSLAALAAGCATPPDHRLGTQGMPADKLAVISAESQEIKIIDVNGKPLPVSSSAEFYLPPGAQKFRLLLNWCPGGQCISYGSYAETPRLACFEAKAGARYRFTVSSIGPNWVPRVTEALGDGAAKAIDSACK